MCEESLCSSMQRRLPPSEDMLLLKHVQTHTPLDVPVQQSGWAGREPHRRLWTPTSLTGYGCCGLSPSVNSIKVSPTRVVFSKNSSSARTPICEFPQCLSPRNSMHYRHVTSFILSFPPRQGGDGQDDLCKTHGGPGTEKERNFPKATQPTQAC